MDRKKFDAITSLYSREIPCDTNTDALFEQTKYLVSFIKAKELTIRQAQLLLKVTSDFLLDEKLI